MTLVEYVILNDKDSSRMKVQADFFEQPTEEFIVEGYCPSHFDIVKGTVYEAPLNPTKKDKTQCKNNTSDTDFPKCVKCWNRKVL